MKHITFYLDFISPYAYLAFEQLPEALAGLSHSVAYRPVLLGAIVRHHGQLAPAEIDAKRRWTYRHVLWLARRQGVPMDMPAIHPYNPLPHLRLAMGTTPGADIGRHVAETLFKEVWVGGADAVEPARLAALAQRLPAVRDGNGEAARAQLKANTDGAIDAGVFGTPAFEVDGRLFWGLDSLPMLRAYLEGDDWFDSAGWREADQRPSGFKK